ncbi:MAG: ribonuclease D, partial [Metallibacterium scheffleri]
MREAQWIDTPAGLDDWLAQLSTDAPSVGIDTEFVRESTFYPRLALLQIAVDDAIALIDPLAFDARALCVWLEAASRICVLHSASEDIEVLRDLLPHGLPQLFDTQIAAAFAGLGAGVGYQRLVSDLLAVELPKDATRSDWMRRPLSQQQHTYAVQDVLHLHALREMLENKLHARGYVGWFMEDCVRLLRRADAPADAQPQRSFRAAAHWPDS